jgi:uncharacterized protein YdiU (UPF0061 family)
MVSPVAIFRVVALGIMLVAPASAQVATKGDVDILERKIMDLDFRLRALEREKEDKRQAEQQAENLRQNNAEWENWRNCRAYRQRIAAKTPTGATETGMMDQLDEISCKAADRFEAKIKARSLDPKK